MGLSGAARSQLAKVKVVFHQRQKTGQKQPPLAVIEPVRFHSNRTQQHLNPLFLGEYFSPLF